MLWPLQVVAKLARSGALVRSEEGFAWANGAWPADFTIPGPHASGDPRAVGERGANIGRSWQCAACGCDGREFRVSVLADALSRTLPRPAHRAG